MMQSRKRLTLILIYAALSLLLIASLSACTRSLQTDAPEVTLGAQEGETTDAGESEDVTDSAAEEVADADAEAEETPAPEEADTSDAPAEDGYPAPEGEEGEAEDTSSPRPEDEASEDAAATPEPEEASSEDAAAEEDADAESSDDAAAETEETTEETAEESQDEAAESDADGDAAEEAADDSTAEDASVERIHIVEAGENLYKIGLEYGLSWVVLQQYNNLPNANSITIGQELRIPPTEEAEEGGEVAGPTPTPNPTDENLYTVRAGDTLDRIGKAYGISWVQIAEANGLVNPNLIKVGQVLKIPTDTPGPTPQFTHTVQYGDTLFKISLRYGVTWPAIAEANDLEAPYKIFPGQELVIPASE